MDTVQLAGSVKLDSGNETKMSENTTMTEALEKVESFDFDSRGRRKSKYLSYPYTNSRPRHKDLPVETEDLKTPCLSHKAEASNIATNSLNRSSFIKLGSKRFRRNWFRKFISCNTMSSSQEFINASPDELLSGLLCKAVDCMSPIEHKSFDLAEWFLCRYRISEYHDEAELATSLVDEEGGKIGKHVGNDLRGIKSEKKRKNNKMENAVRPKMKSLSGLSDLNMNISPCDTLMPGKKLKQKRKVEEIISLNQLPNVKMTINESSSKCNSVFEATQNLICLAAEGKAGPKKREKKEAALEHQSAPIASPYIDAKCTKGSSLVIDLQPLSSPIPRDTPEKSNGENKEELVLVGSNPQLRVYQKGLVGNVTNHSLLVSTAPEVDTVSQERCAGNIINHSSLLRTALKVGTVSQERHAGNIPNKSLLVNSASEVGIVSQKVHVGNISNHGLLVRTASEVGTFSVNNTGLKNRMEKATEKHINTKLTLEIPDLNGTSPESKEFETVNFLSSELKSQQSRSSSACTRPPKTPNYDRMEDSGESLGTCLLLQFTPGVYVPSKEDLLRMFCLFGPLKASETQLLKDTGSARIVFVRSADAIEAFHGIEQNKPFGATLVDYKLQHLSTACAPVEPFVTPTQPARSMPWPGEAPPPLEFIKQNLQMMASILENSGNNLSPQMKAKLDTEIKNLLRKVNSQSKV